jgi:predicted DNA-binding transcriptional regulator AlpA
MVRESRTFGSSGEVADYLGVAANTLKQWRHRNIGPKYIKIGGYAKYRWSDVDAWLERQPTGGTAA